MTLIDGIKGTAAASGGHVVCQAIAQPRESGVSQRRRLQRTSAPSHNLVAAVPSIVRIAFGGTTVAIAGVIEGRTAYAGRSDLSPSSNLRCAHRSVRHHIHRRPRNVARICDSSAGFCLAETMGLRSGGSGMGGASAMAHRHIFQ